MVGSKSSVKTIAQIAVSSAFVLSSANAFANIRPAVKAAEKALTSGKTVVRPVAPGATMAPSAAGNAAGAARLPRVVPLNARPVHITEAPKASETVANDTKKLALPLASSTAADQIGNVDALYSEAVTAANTQFSAGSQQAATFITGVKSGFFVVGKGVGEDSGKNAAKCLSELSPEAAQKLIAVSKGAISTLEASGKTITTAGKSVLEDVRAQFAQGISTELSKTGDEVVATASALATNCSIAKAAVPVK